MIVRGCSTPSDMLFAIADGVAVVLLVLEDREAPCLEIVGQLAMQIGRPLVIAVTNEKNADLEWPLRELGTTSVVSDRITSDELFALCNRMLGVTNPTRQRGKRESLADASG
jgi:hypothetical protein